MGLQRSDDDLEKAAGHIGYEWAMLLGGRHADWHKLPAGDRSPTTLANSHSGREITLLHTRTLYEFLFGPRMKKRPHPDDIRAADFLEGKAKSDWESDRLEKYAPKWCTVLTDNYSRLNKQLFHLSYSRDKPSERWDPHPPIVIEELTVAFKHFRKRLTTARRLLFDAGVKSCSDGRFLFLD